MHYEFSVSLSLLRKLALSYIFLPVLLFFMLWLSSSIAAAAVLILLAVCGWAIFPKVRKLFPLWSTRNDVLFLGGAGSPFGPRKEREAIKLDCKALVILIAVAMAWVFFSGIGSFWAQSTDFGARNGIFEDLISHSWPVYYNNGEFALVYYFAFWLPPAAIGKIILNICGSLTVAMAVANISLYLWSVIGILLVEVLAACLVRAKGTWQFIIVAIVLVFFSGLDIVGILFMALKGLSEPAIHAFSIMHLEQWAGSSSVQFSSNTTLLFWVFNQTIIPWICTALVLLERNPSCYVVIALPCLATGPYPFIGFFIICVAKGFGELCSSFRSGQLGVYFRNVFSPANLLASLLSLIFAVFFLGSQSVSTSGDRLDLIGLAPGASISLILLFYFLEIGIYAILLHSRFKGNLYYWVSLFCLAVLPFVHFGSAYEVCFRASIPFLLIMCLMCMRILLEELPSILDASPKNKITAWMLALSLIVGSITPIFEFARGIVAVSEFGIESSLQVPIDLDTLVVEEGAQSNFKSETGTSAFFTYLAQPYEEK